VFRISVAIAAWPSRWDICIAALYTLGWAGRNNSKSSSGSSGHTGDTRPGQTPKKVKDLSVREGEDRVSGVCVGVYTVFQCV
jgi:hypothetical protein